MGGCWGRESLVYLKKKPEVLLCVFERFMLHNVWLKHTHLGLHVDYIGVSTLYIG